MAFHALADYQNHVIGWLQWNRVPLEMGRGTISANLDVIWGMSVDSNQVRMYFYFSTWISNKSVFSQRR